jgi:formate dehydrogenase alpha subunit
MTNSIAELSGPDVILIAGSNTTEQHPIISGRIIDAVRKGASLIIFDPRLIQLTPYAEMHLRQRPGTDVAYINAMMKVIVDEDLYDREFVEQRTEGFEELKKSLEGSTPEWAEEITGIPGDDIVKAAKEFAAADKASIVYCMGITQHVSGTDNVKALADLAMLTGNIGRLSTGVNPLRGQNNVQGACDMGGLPNVFTGYQPVTDEAARKKFEKAWGASLPESAGLTLMEMMEGAIEGSVEFMMVLGENPVISDPNSAHVRKALEKVPFLVVEDIMDTDTTALADVVLPGACWAEKDGTFTNTERRVQRVRKAVEPPGEAHADWQVICDIAKAAGGKGFDFDDVSQVFDEMRALTPQYAGMSYARLEDAGIQWPCPDEESLGKKFLHEGHFTRGKGKFEPVSYRPPAEPCDEEFPLALMTGRLAFQYHTGTMTRQSPTLDREVNSAFVEVNPEDADAMGLKSGEPAKVASRRGELVVETKVTDRVKPGQVFMPFHFAEASANVLTSDALDPVCRIPELKVCAVKLSKP